jgi:N-acylglucosamine-6-phosphate 2-epimerase
LSNDSKLQLREVSYLRPLKNGLIVSCQVPDDTPINTPEFIAAQALTVIQAGAYGIRAQGIANVAAISKVTKLPIIGLVKRYENSSPIYITPLIEDVLELEQAGAQIVAVDATERNRPGGINFEEFMKQLRTQSSVQILADIDSVSAALVAQDLGCDAVATTLSGYTDLPVDALPNIKLIEELSAQVTIPIIAEGGFNQTQSVKAAFEAGAWSVCIGTAITNPFLLTKHFLTAIN